MRKMSRNTCECACIVMNMASGSFHKPQISLPPGNTGYVHILTLVIVKMFKNVFIVLRNCNSCKTSIVCNVSGMVITPQALMKFTVASVMWALTGLRLHPAHLRDGVNGFQEAISIIQVHSKVWFQLWSGVELR